MSSSNIGQAQNLIVRTRALLCSWKLLLHSLPIRWRAKRTSKKKIVSLSLWVCEEISQVFRTNHLGVGYWKSLATSSAIPYPINRGCRHQEPRHRLCLAYIVGAADAYHQPNGYRLYPQMVVASHISAYQHLVGERLLHQTLEVADVFL